MGRATISDIWDSRHLMIILDSEEDAKIALTSPLRKVGHVMFRLFRYTPDYNPRREATVTTKWIRLPSLHPGFVTKNYVACIVNSFGHFLGLDTRSKACTTLKYIRACVEVDVTKPIPKEVRISLSDGRMFRREIEVEGNMFFCSQCKIHGHTLSDCRKKKPAQHMDQAHQNEVYKPTTTQGHNSIAVTIPGGPEIHGNKSDMSTKVVHNQAISHKKAISEQQEEGAVDNETHAGWTVVNKRKGSTHHKQQAVLQQVTLPEW